MENLLCARVYRACMSTVYKSLFLIHTNPCSVTQSYLTPCDPMDCSTPGLSVPHHLPKFAQVHVHCISDAISSPDALFSFCPQSFPASGTFQ